MRCSVSVSGDLQEVQSVDQSLESGDDQSTSSTVSFASSDASGVLDVEAILKSPSGKMAAAQSGKGRDAAHLRGKQLRRARPSSSMSSRIAAGRIRGARYGADVRAASCVAVCQVDRLDLV